MNENYQIELTLGDMSGDGHGRSKSFLIQSSLNKKELQDAYEKAVKKTKVDLVNSVAIDYEENTISEKFFKKLQKAGVKLDDLFFEDEDGDIDYQFSEYEIFAELYLRMAKLIVPEFTYSFIELPRIRLGGYGLFFV